MSLPSSTVQCRGCNFQDLIIPQPIELHYWLPTGESLKHYPCTVWCPSCDAITRAEGHFDERPLLAELKKLQRAERWQRLFRYLFRFKPADEENNSLSEAWRSPPLKEQIADIHAKVQLVYLRKSAPKCLTCGNTGVVNLDFGKNEAEIATHACGGGLYIVEEDYDTKIRIHYCKEIVDLDVEGNKIQAPTDQKPQL